MSIFVLTNAIFTEPDTGQFSHADSKSKLPIKKGDKFYIDINHEVIGSIHCFGFILNIKTEFTSNQRLVFKDSLLKGFGP